MIVEVTMSNIVVDSSAVNHGSKHISTGADPIPNATESAGGIVKLGATGVPDAAKVPKALGADLVALITAAGYTLSPAEGTASLDGIADGTTYKRVLAAVATILNATPPTAAGITDANAIAALSKVANLKLFINAAGNGFEYANGFKIITATHDISTTSGAKAITGVGFKPSWAIIIQAVDGTKMFSVGISHGTSHGAAYTQDGVSADTWSYQNNKSFTALVDNSNHCIGYVSSWDSDGATLTLAKTGSPTGTSYMTILFGR